ncbi:hypothetical protein ABZY45_12820 [Streptomyces sp. NPDC006516]|uniref:hypothetical protein n=1 Tax=Streptomyces sp. NPDC006516 TaxID=3154309 RepID=UPI0033B90E85
MAFQEHVTRAAVEIVKDFPVDDGIYAVTFRIDSVDQDPRYPYVAIGCTTEADCAEATATGADSWEARWSYACFPVTGLEGVRSVGLEAEGAEAHRQEAESRQLWYEDGDEPGSADERLVEWFHEVCVGAARHLHESGRIVEALGRPVPVILYDMFDPEAMFELASAANPAALITEFMAEEPTTRAQ